MNKDKKPIIEGWMIIPVLFLIGIVSMIVYNAITAGHPQVFTDVISENTSMQGSNKTAERNLFYIFSVVGSFLYTFWYFISKRNASYEEKKTIIYDRKIPIIGLTVILIIRQFVFPSVDPITITFTVFCFAIVVANMMLLTEGSAFFFMCMYSLCAIYRIYVYCGGENDLQVTHICLATLIIALSLIPLSAKIKDIYVRATMILQLTVPFLLLVFLVSDYNYQGADINIQVPMRLRLFILICMAAMFAESVIILIKKHKDRILRLGDIISYSSCIAIITYNGFNNKGAIISSDYHHPYENIIGFSQIFELSQRAFSDYIPISGAYSVLTGAVFYLFGKGKVTYYNVTQNLFCFLIVILMVILLKKCLINREWMFLIAVLYKIIAYNRIFLILPIALILMNPTLMRKSNTWLKVWFLSSLIHGLYYPLFGAAEALAFLPLAVLLTIRYVKSGEFKKDAGHISYYVYWGICLLPAVVSVPWLVGTFKHIRAMGEQTIYTDGLTRFSQLLPDSLITYSSSTSVKLIAYYTMTYIFPVSIIWISVALALYVGEAHIENKRIIIGKPEQLCLAISFGILMLVSFSYTVIRMDLGSIYSRSGGVIYSVFVLIIIVSDRYIRNEKIKRMAFAYALLLIGVSGVGYTSLGTNSKLESRYTVPEGYQHTDGSGNRLGESFIYKDDAVYEKCEQVAVLEKDRSYFALGDFGYYYLYDLKGDGAMEAFTVRGYDAAKEAIDIFLRNKTYIGTDMDSIGNYYLYRWIVTSGRYIWDDTAKLFTPCEEDISSDLISEMNKKNTVPKESPLLMRTAASWGDSMSSLNGIFSEVEKTYELERNEYGINITFDEELDGNDLDFIYFEVDNDKNYDYKFFHVGYGITQNIENEPFCSYLLKKDYNPGENVIISWEDDNGNRHDMSCCLGRGKLLIPIGGGKGWLQNMHNGIELSMADDSGASINMGDVSGVRFLKLRELSQ